VFFAPHMRHGAPMTLIFGVKDTVGSLLHIGLPNFSLIGRQDGYGRSHTSKFGRVASLPVL